MVDRNKEDWQTMRRKANSSPGLSSNNETNMARKTVQDNKSMDMDVTKTISIANAVDKDLSSSARIKSVFNKIHKGMLIKHCKRTMNGFILIEVDTVENAKNDVSTWDPEKHFSFKDKDGNARKTSAVLLEDARAKGVIADVDKELTDEEMTKDLQVTYSKATAKRFRNKIGPTYSVLLTFNSNEDLEHGIANNVTVCDIPFRVRVYESKKRVLQCYKCNGFKHVASVCSKEQVCAFCGEGHKESDCRVKEESQRAKFKCSNCGKNHSAFEKTCEEYLKMVKSLNINDGS